ncbi:MAG: 3-hydroxy-5-phosphonooxypentane-2,4-dione thiolase [Candidatus Sumerlaeota bacterium]|nr:3-hydroxy-5-phosphonooxypentane-2,4-dione thiolase [Candidatus Sumerlaeota bacterium]
MAEGQGNLDAKDYGIGIPVKTEAFFLKGANHLGWGMQQRLSRIFNPKSGRTVMLAFDHGYIMGPTSGLERMDLTVVPLAPYADTLMCTRGALRAVISPTTQKAVVLRCSAGATVLKELSDECVGVSIEDAIRCNASAMAVQVYIGSEFEHKTIQNLVRLIDAGNSYDIPTLGVTAVGREMVRDARYLSLACRVCAELGAHFIKTYFCEPDFEKVTASCPVPIVIAGGKKLPEAEALQMAYKAIDQGAAGVDMGRNIFQADDPIAMIQAVRAVVHDLMKPEKALELYYDLMKSAKKPAKKK